MACMSKSGRKRPSCDVVGLNCELKLPGASLAVAYEACPRELAMTLVAAEDSERPSLPLEGASSGTWSAGASPCALTERTGGVMSVP